MIQAVRNLVEYRELLAALAWKNVALRYKQSYLGIAWAVLKPLVLMLIFMLVRSFVGIESGEVPYALLTFAALLPWIFFQESANDGVGSIVNNAHLIRKIYLPREIFPLTAVLTRTVEMAINFVILSALMAWFGYGLKASMVWVPLILALVVCASLTIALAGAAINVYLRDVNQLVPMLLSLLMYASPVIYPLALVQKTLLLERAAGGWSEALYLLYSLNPMAGLIDAFQRAMLLGTSPDWRTLAPSMLFIGVLLPASYIVFKRAEAYFADVI